MPFGLSEKILRKSENLLSKPLNEENTCGIRDLKHLRNENPFRVIIGHININSIRNKFEPLVKYVGNNLDILMVSETKIDDTFPESQFLIEGFSTPYRLDRTAKGGGILVYIRQDIPSKYIKKLTVNESFEGFFVEINLRSKKWLLGCSYNPHKEKIISHLNNLSTALDKLCTNYENIILLGDFNVEVEEKNMFEFMNLCNLRNLIKQNLFEKP